MNNCETEGENMGSGVLMDRHLGWVMVRNVLCPSMSIPTISLLTLTQESGTRD